MSLEDAIKSFARGMKKCAEIIEDFNPDIIISPMMGSVPFMDAFYIVDRNFDPNSVFYMPASSHIFDAKNVIKDWMTNFFSKNICLDEPVKILSIDEVISGGSAVRVNNAILTGIKKRKAKIVQESFSPLYNFDHRESIRDVIELLDTITEYKYSEDIFFNLLSKNYGKNRFEISSNEVKRMREILNSFLDEKISFLSIGVEDSKNGKYDFKSRNRSYVALKEEGVVVPVSVDTILTLDNPLYCPLRYQTLSGMGNNVHNRFKGVIVNNKFISDEYMGLLQKINHYEGDRDNVMSICFERAKFSSDYLSPEFINPKNFIGRLKNSS